jgi:hypothetical protein
MLKSDIGLENLDSEVNINRIWETTRDDIKMSAKKSLGFHELKKHEPWFYKRYSDLLRNKSI